MSSSSSSAPSWGGGEEGRKKEKKKRSRYLYQKLSRQHLLSREQKGRGEGAAILIPRAEPFSREHKPSAMIHTYLSSAPGWHRTCVPSWRPQTFRLGASGRNLDEWLLLLGNPSGNLGQTDRSCSLHMLGHQAVSQSFVQRRSVIHPRALLSLPFYCVQLFSMTTHSYACLLCCLPWRRLQKRILQPPFSPPRRHQPKPRPFRSTAAPAPLPSFNRISC